MITFLALGGANEIGASCYFVDIHSTTFILDCGTHPQKKGTDSIPKFSLIDDRTVDHVLITHAHQDHMDALPFLVKKFPYSHITTTPQTRGLAELTLHNAVKIITEQLSEESILAPYTHEEIDLLIQSIHWKSYEETFHCSGFNRTADPVLTTFFDVGHILGSTGILLEHDDRSIFYTGDFCLEKQFILPGAQLPKRFIDTLIMECTHGSTLEENLPDRIEETKRFIAASNKVLEEGGSILIPVFALGKMQEILAMIGRAMEKGSLARVNVYTAGLGRKINSIYDKNRYTVPFNNPDEEISSMSNLDIYDIEQLQDVMRTPSIVLASSGMVVEGTLSYKLAQLWLQYRRNAIFTVGYMDPLTPGYRIQKAKKGDTIQMSETQEPRRVQCSIQNFRFSAHSSRQGLLTMVERLKPQRVILVHGDPQSIDWMGNAILTQFPRMKVHGAEIGVPITIND